MTDTEVADIEEYARTDRHPPKCRRYRIRIDRQRFLVDEPCLSGRELLVLARKRRLSGPSNGSPTQLLALMNRGVPLLAPTVRFTHG